MRFVLTAILMVHGAIHVLGFLEWTGLTDVPQLSGRTLWTLTPAGRWTFGALWLVALLLLIVAGAAQLGGGDGWALPAILGVLLSQALILFAWKDAQAGTAVNVLLMLPIASAFAHARFVSNVDAEVRALYAAPAEQPERVVTPEEVRALPAPVATWLERAGVVDRAPALAVRLKQRGWLRTSPTAAWMPADAQQYFTTSEPAFVWQVDARLWGILPLTGRDRYSAGSGHMLIKAASLLDVIDARDEKIAHGALLRFLGEIVWFPSAALSPYLTWKARDGSSAEATIVHAGLSASAVFHFDEQGRMVGLSAERYLGGGDAAKLTPWSASCTAWSRFGGIEVPTRGVVRWRLAEGDFDYFRWEVTEVEYDPLEAP